ncbi:MAG: hypothetical protein IPG11_15980 [Flavobacteriales bacterium]|jgi:hypothetical protein|nr:hypothetical protein [Flavobacteriales bacterium]MBK6551883.1 hypothetical protein [Flavobacteriales bacterium]MBK7482299.1 hypothetical protein [Flavobacteriales bacterium]MBK7620835.1 hypothetical protein [Flavobacteriales bacterium]MBK8708711.1 hypothetical protein [Flavobacteriales bacterium]
MVALLTLLMTTALVFAWVLWRRLAVLRAERDELRAMLASQQPAPMPEAHDADTAWCATPFLSAALEERARTEYPRPSPMLELLQRELRSD